MKKELQNGVHSILENLANALGYDDLSNLFLSVLLLRNWLVVLEVTVLAASITFIGVLEQYVYAPFFSLVLFNLLILAESATGTRVVLLVKKEKFDLGKSLRILTKLVAQNLVLSLAFNMGTAEAVYIWLPPFIWVAFTGVNFLKVLRNLTLTNDLDGWVAEVMQKQFSDKYQIKIHKDKKENEQNDKNPTN